MNNFEAMNNFGSLEDGAAAARSKTALENSFDNNAALFDKDETVRVSGVSAQNSLETDAGYRPEKKAPSHSSPPPSRASLSPVPLSQQANSFSTESAQQSMSIITCQQQYSAAHEQTSTHTVHLPTTAAHTHSHTSQDTVRHSTQPHSVLTVTHTHTHTLTHTHITQTTHSTTLGRSAHLVLTHTRQVIHNSPHLTAVRPVPSCDKVLSILPVCRHRQISY